MKIKIQDLNVGDEVIVDNGFPCMKPGKKIVRNHEKYGLYVVCSEGFHCLAGQVEEDGYLIGVEVNEH